jgi:hypothetical protein
MRTKVLLLVLAAMAAACGLAGSAMASGPAAPGKDTVTITCEGVGVVTVSVQRGENSNGAGQVVDAQGHGIPAAFGFTLTDVTTNTVVDTEGPFGTGNGNAHPNQPTVSCTGVEFDGTASDFFGTQRPPGVAATDEILATFTVDVILKNV